MVLAMLAASALADEADARRALWDALLAEAAQGELEDAVQRYRQLSRTLGTGPMPTIIGSQPTIHPPVTESPTQSDALYWLGHGLYQLGRVDDARSALLDGVRSGRCPHCRDLLEEIELEEHCVTAVPTVWTFDATVMVKVWPGAELTYPVAGGHGLFHPFAVQHHGGIRVAPAPDGERGQALQWSTLADEREPDRLELGLRTKRAHQIRFTVRSTTLDALLEVRADDVIGRAYVWEPIELPRGETHRVVVALDALTSVEDGAPLDPTQVARIEIVDRSGLRASGANVLWIDDFEIR